MTHLRIAPPRPQAVIADLPFHQWSFPDGTRWTEFHRIPGGYLLRFPDLADFQVSSDGREIAAYPLPGTGESTTEHLYLNQVLPLALSKQGRLVFHGSAVERDGRAIAFVGSSGRGKSTLAASFARAGFPFLTDDGLVLTPSPEGDWLVEPSHPSLRLWGDSERAVLGPGAKVAPAVAFTDKARFLAGDELPFCDAPRRLRRVYFLGEGSASELSIRALTGAEAAIAWVSHSFVLDVEEKPRLAAQFHQVSALARTPIHFALDFPRRFEDLDRLREAILDHGLAAGD